MELRGREPALGAAGGVLEEVQKSGKVRAHADLATTGPALGWDASLSPGSQLDVELEEHDTEWPEGGNVPCKFMN